MRNDRFTSDMPAAEPPGRIPRWLGICRRRLVTEPMRLAQREGPARGSEPTSEAEPRLDLQVAVVFVTAAVALTLLEYFVKGGHSRLAGYLDAVGLGSLAAWLRAATEQSPAHHFNDLAYFSLGCT